jgi:ubiquinone/menaquinone biosynthesis C-methylase UbiE
MDRHVETPRYDRLADWYDQFLAHYGDLSDPMSSASQLARLLGHGGGVCLDVACGGGLHHAAIASTGRTVVGVDLSRDQLGVALGRTRDLVRANAGQLPFQDASFPTVVCTYLHTDIDDMGPVFAESRRVLRPGGMFVYLGVHPCFWGHFLEDPQLPNRTLHPGYLETGWIETPYSRKPDGLRAKVGARHVTLSELVNGVLAAGLHILRLEEPPCKSGHADRLAIVCSRPIS